MRLLELLPVGLSLAQWSTAAALPSSTGLETCKNPPKRVEWRQLSVPQKKSYIDAVLCLSHTEAKSGLSGTVNRFDDHQAVHMLQKPQIHWVGHFLLWHRYFVATYEKALRDECGYTGGQPYWDWSLDAEPRNENSTHAFESDIFDPETGFGGNGYPVQATPEQNRLNITGNTGGGCVMNGPFAPPHFAVNVPTPHCLKRDFVPWIINRFADRNLVEEVLAQPDYTSLARTVEKKQSFDPPNIHASGHFGVGGILGTMGNAAESPGDPLFYLHHGNIDRIFWEWQQKDLETRLNTGMSPPQATSLLAGGSGRRAAGTITQGLPMEDKDKGPNKGDILNGAVSWTRDLMWMLYKKMEENDELAARLRQATGEEWPEMNEDEKRMKSEILEAVERNGAGTFRYSRGPGSGLRVPKHTNLAGEPLSGLSPQSLSPGMQSTGSGSGSNQQQYWSNQALKEEDEFGMDMN